MRRIVFPVLRAALLLALWIAAPVRADAGADIYLFWRQGCPHCEREIAFLRQFEAGNPAIRVHYFDIGSDVASRTLLVRTGELLAADISSVPFTVVGDEVFAGYLNDATTGEVIRRRALHCLANPCPDSVRPLLSAGNTAPAPVAKESARAPPSAREIPASITLPLVGEVATKNLSLPMLTVVLAALDGFNPCAMWTLMLLLGLLIGMHDKRRRWILGSAFIVASAAVYFLFMAAWLNLFLIIGISTALRLALGGVALVIGGFNVKDFFTLGQGFSLSIPASAKPGLYARMRAVLGAETLFPSLTAVAILAMTVNFIELLCTAGFPALYTAVLTQQELSPSAHYAYLGLYILGYIADDSLMVATAVIALSSRKLTERAGRWLKLLSGAVMLVLGGTLILRPEWLV